MSKKFSDFELISSAAELENKVEEKRYGEGTTSFVGYSTPDDNNEVLGVEQRFNISDMTDVANPERTDLVPQAPLVGIGTEDDVFDLVPGSNDSDMIAHRGGEWGVADASGSVESGLNVTSGSVHIIEPNAPSDDFLVWDDDSGWTTSPLQASVKSQPGVLSGDGSAGSPLILKDPDDPVASEGALVRVSEAEGWSHSEVSVGSGINRQDADALQIWPKGDTDGQIYNWSTSKGGWSAESLSDIARSDGVLIDGGGSGQSTSSPIHLIEPQSGDERVLIFDTDTDQWEYTKDTHIFPLGASKNKPGEPSYADFLHQDLNPRAVSRQFVNYSSKRHFHRFTQPASSVLVKISLGTITRHEVVLETSFFRPEPVKVDFELSDLVPGSEYLISVKAGDDSAEMFMLGDDVATLGGDLDTDIFSSAPPISSITVSKGFAYVLDEKNLLHNNLTLNVVVGTDTAYAKITYPSGLAEIKPVSVDGDDWVSWYLPHYGETVIRWNGGQGSFDPGDNEVRVDFLDQASGGDTIGRGGGGGGGTVTGTSFVVNPVTIQVGGRTDFDTPIGQGAATQGFSGSVEGGGRGGSGSGAQLNGGSGGSGGGGVTDSGLGGAGSVGFDGGGGAGWGAIAMGGGGGGSSESGGHASDLPSSHTGAGYGGAGVPSSITGWLEHYGAGGGGGGGPFSPTVHNSYNLGMAPGGLGGGGEGGTDGHHGGGMIDESRHGWGGRGAGGGGNSSSGFRSRGDRGCVIARGRFAPAINPNKATIDIEGDYEAVKIGNETLVTFGLGDWSYEITGAIPVATIVWISGGGGGGSGGGGGGAGAYEERVFYNLTGKGSGYCGEGGDSGEIGGHVRGFGLHLIGGSPGATSQRHSSAGACGGGNYALLDVTIEGGRALIGHSGGEAGTYSASPLEHASGGGGGMGWHGGDGSGTAGGNGGAGILSDISGDDTFYCAGGGGSGMGAGYTGTPGLGGSGGAGGRGGWNSIDPATNDGEDATTYGSGGGGSTIYYSQGGGKGGDAVVFLRGVFDLAGEGGGEFMHLNPTPAHILQYVPGAPIIDVGEQDYDDPVKINPDPGPIVQVVPQGKNIEIRENDDSELINIGKPDVIIEP